jgi:hypothetical protein
MNRRRWIVGAGGLLGALTALNVAGERRAPAWSAQAPVAVRPVEAVGATLAAGEEAELRDGLSVRFVGVTRDNRCPADLECYVAGSADAVLAFTLSDERQNVRSFDQAVEFSPRRKVLVYDTDAYAIVGDLSGDTSVDPADIVLSLYLVLTDRLSER